MVQSPSLTRSSSPSPAHSWDSCHSLSDMRSGRDSLASGTRDFFSFSFNRKCTSGLEVQWSWKCSGLGSGSNAHRLQSVPRLVSGVCPVLEVLSSVAAAGSIVAAHSCDCYVFGYNVYSC